MPLLSQRDKIGGSRIYISKSGAVNTFKAKDCNLRDIYSANNFSIPEGMTLKYLKP